MRIHFMINGVGLGHVYRQLPIMKSLAKRHKITTSAFGNALRVLEDNGYPDSYELEPFGDIIAHSTKVDVHLSLIENLRRLSPKLLKKTSDVISSSRPDVVVVDGYLFGLIAAKMHGKKTVNVANCTKLWYVFPMINKIVERSSNVFSKGIIDSSDLVLVPDFAPPFAFSNENIDYFGVPKKFYFVGPTALVKEKKKGRRPLVSAGGSGIQHRYFDDVIDVLDKMGYNPIVADGSLEDEEIYDAIARAPFSVVHGGHTTITSSISANAAVIPIPVKGYRERLNNALGAERVGCGIVLDPQFFDHDAAMIALEKIKTHYVKENTAIFSRAAHAMQGHLKAAELIEKLEKSTKRSIKIF